MLSAVSLRLACGPPRSSVSDRVGSVQRCTGSELERSGPAERGRAGLNSWPWHVRQVGRLGYLVHDVTGCCQRGLVEERGDLEEPQWDLHPPVHRIVLAEDGAGEDEQSPAVVRRVLLQVGLQTQPEFEALIEFCGLRCCICVVEGVFVGWAASALVSPQTAEARRTNCPRSMSFPAYILAPAC